MADNLNTPSLPEIKPLSRCHVMAGLVTAAATGGATSAAFAITETPIVGIPTITEFAARCRKWHSAYDAVQLAYEESGRLIDELGGFPEFPSELREPLRATDGTEEKPEDQYRNGDPSPCWSAGKLQDIIRRGGLAVCEAERIGNRLTIVHETKRLPDKELQRAQNMLLVAEEHERKRRDFMDQCRAIEDVPNDMSRQAWNEAKALFSTPVYCMASLAHKVAIIRQLELFDSDGDNAEDLAM